MTFNELKDEVLTCMTKAEVKAYGDLRKRETWETARDYAIECGWIEESKKQVSNDITTEVSNPVTARVSDGATEQTTCSVEAWTDEDESERRRICVGLAVSRGYSESEAINLYEWASSQKEYGKIYDKFISRLEGGYVPEEYTRNNSKMPLNEQQPTTQYYGETYHNSQPKTLDTVSNNKQSTMMMTPNNDLNRTYYINHLLDCYSDVDRCDLEEYSTEWLRRRAVRDGYIEDEQPLNEHPPQPEPINLDSCDEVYENWVFNNKPNSVVMTCNEVDKFGSLFNTSDGQVPTFNIGGQHYVYAPACSIVNTSRTQLHQPMVIMLTAMILITEFIISTLTPVVTYLYTIVKNRTTSQRRRNKWYAEIKQLMITA